MLPQIAGAVGARLRLRINAQDVILSRTAPEGLSALNTLPVRVIALTPEGAGGVVVSLIAPGDVPLMARITRRSADALALSPGAQVHAVLKAVAVETPS